MAQISQNRQIDARNRNLDDLEPNFKRKVYELLAKLTEAGIAVMLVETKRSESQHQEDLATGHSWVKRSKHQDGLAVDVCPYDTYLEHGQDKLQWDSGDPIWYKVGAIGESLGLVWGGRWAQKDMGHFEEAS